MNEELRKELSDEESDAVGYFQCAFQYVQSPFFRYLNGRRKVKWLFNHKDSKVCHPLDRFRVDGAGYDQKD